MEIQRPWAACRPNVTVVKANDTIPKLTSMSENNAMTEGAASEEETTVKTETCKKCNGSGYYTVYDEPYGLPVDVECCALCDDLDEYIVRAMIEFGDPDYCWECQPDPGFHCTC